MPFRFRGACGEACPPSASQARALDRIDDLVGVHSREDGSQCAVSLDREIVLNLFRIDTAAATQDDALLSLVEGDIPISWNCLIRSRIAIEEAFYRYTVLQM